jgi:glycosyltransferase involved in cell wall biosynthesis
MCITDNGNDENLDAVVDAFGRIADRIQEDLVIAGSDPQRSKRAAARRGVLGGRVLIRPQVSEREKAELLDGAKVVVCMPADEGPDLPPLEAMARGLPIVTRSREVRPRERAGGPIHVDAKDPTGLASVLHALLSEEEQPQRLPACGGEQTSSWPVSARRHLDLFRQVLGRPMA